MASSLESHLGYWMRTISNHVSLEFERKLATKDVTVAEWVVLRLLFDDVLSPREVAKRVGMTKGAVSKVVDRLDAKGFLRIESGIQDRRSLSIQLSESGRAIVPILAKFADQNDAEFFGHLLDKQRQELLEQLRDLAAHLNLSIIPTE